MGNAVAYLRFGNPMAKQPVETTLYSLDAKPPARPERRNDERYVSLLRVGALLIDGRRELCLVRNISAGGMLIRPYSAIEQGTEVSIELKHGETVAGIAKWSQDGLLGITFDTPIDVVALLSGSAQGPNPRMPRIELSCTAWVREGADIHRTRTVNISQGGMCVEGSAELRVGAEVIVSLAGLGPLAGMVKWKDGDCHGIRFNTVLAVNELMKFLQQQQRLAQRCAAA
jgi:hypothetical protein